MNFETYFLACRSLLIIREADQEVFSEELRIAERELSDYKNRDLQQTSSDLYPTANLNEVENLRVELQQLESDHEAQINTLRRDYENQIEILMTNKNQVCYIPYVI